LREIGFPEIDIVRFAAIENAFFECEPEERRVTQDAPVEFELRGGRESRPICAGPIDPQSLAFLQHGGAKSAGLHLHEAQVAALEMTPDEPALREGEFTEIACAEGTLLKCLAGQAAPGQIDAGEMALEEFIRFTEWHDRGSPEG